MTADSLRIFCVLTYRDLRFMFWELGSRLIDGAIIVLMQTLAIGQFLPLLGMPIELIGPLYIGTITQIIFSAAYGISFRYVADLKHTKFINYQLGLPLSKTALFAQLIVSMMIEIALISLPLIGLGSLFLGQAFSLNNAQLLPAIIMYLLTLFFYALLFIYLAFSSEYTWFIDNIWARRLSPLFLLGCAYFTWKKLYAFNATIGMLLLCNPLTYIHEGLRATLLGPEEFLSAWLCFGMITIFSILLIVLLARSIKKRLDPV